MMQSQLDYDAAALDALAVRAQAGEGVAFDELLLATQKEVRLFLAVRSPDAELVGEIVQAAFVTAFHRLGDYQPRGTFTSWLKGIGHNLLRAELRRRLRHQSTDTDALDVLMCRVRAAEIEAEDPTVVASVAGEWLAHLERCLERLSPRARALIDRRYRLAEPINRMAQQFKQPAGAIASALHRIRVTLRKCLDGGAP